MGDSVQTLVAEAAPGTHSQQDDSEFMLPGNQGERNRMDLLSVVMHEVGHLLGQDHDRDGVMAETLAAGVRQTGLHDDHGAVVDQVFSTWGQRSSDAWLSAWWSAQAESEQNPHRDLRAKLASGKAR